MLRKIFKNKFKILAAFFVVLCFGLIRSFERQLFYDPFLDYFEADFKLLPFPDVAMLKLFCGLFFRYFLNTVLSLMLLYILFRDPEMLKFSLFLYAVFFVLLFIAFFIILKWLPDASWLLFYVRRFIIQPLFVLLFIPAFYFQQQNLKK